MEEEIASRFLKDAARSNMARSIECGLPVVAACVGLLLLVDMAANICTDNN